MTLGPLALSLEIALVSTALASALGVTLAGLLARARFWGRDLVDVLVAAPLVLPPTVLGYYLLLVLGRDTPVGRVYEAAMGSPLVFTKQAAVLAGTIAALPFVARSARAAIEDVDPRLVGAAATLGASPLRVFVTIALPLARNGILAGVTLGFARALGDFGVTLMIAGNLPGLTQTGALAVYDAVQASREAEAAGLAAVLAAFAIVALYAGNKLARRAPHEP